MHCVATFTAMRFLCLLFSAESMLYVGMRETFTGTFIPHHCRTAPPGLWMQAGVACLMPVHIEKHCGNLCTLAMDYLTST